MSRQPFDLGYEYGRKCGNATARQADTALRVLGVDNPTARSLYEP